MTAYEIFRDGQLHATVGPVTAYTDDSVAPGTAYERARQGRRRQRLARQRSRHGHHPDRRHHPSSTPAVTATAVSFDRVDLSWTAATDDRGVTEYRILRDGALLETVGPDARTYSDRSVAPATGYDYSVRAVDAAGNVSDPSPAATATTPARTVFLDGFESGDLSQWTGGAGITVEQGGAFAGSFAARAATTSSARYRYKQLASTYRELHYRLRFKLVSQADSFSLLKLRTAWVAAGAALAVGHRQALDPQRPDRRHDHQHHPDHARGWHVAKLAAIVDGPASRLDVWLDGDKINSLSKPEALGSTPIGRIQLADDAAGKSYDVLFDDVAVDAPPANDAAPTIAGTARDGETLSADRGSWSGSEPLSYSYGRRRCDGAGRTAPTSPAPAPRPTRSPPPTSGTRSASRSARRTAPGRSSPPRPRPPPWPRSRRRTRAPRRSPAPPTTARR